VLTHLEVRDLIELAMVLNGKQTVIKKDESNSFFEAELLNAVISVLELFGRDSETLTLNIEVLGNVDQPRAPSTSKIEESISVLKV
jgi:hypothetical protein